MIGQNAAKHFLETSLPKHLNVRTGEVELAEHALRPSWYLEGEHVHPD